MSENLRFSQPGDEPSLKRLWKAVFCDEDSYIEGFFKHMYHPGSAVVLECDGSIVASAYLLYIGNAAEPDGKQYPCTVIYALGTYPDFRGRGYAAEITKAAIASSFSNGASFNTLCPAEKSLFSYYESKVGYSAWFYTSESLLLAEKLPVLGFRWGISPISPKEYIEIRESCLISRFHIAFNECAIEYQNHLCGINNGGLFLLEINDTIGCAAAEYSPDGILIVKELLMPDTPVESAVSLISSLLPANKYSVRSPAGGRFAASGQARPFAMIYPSPELITLSKPKLPPWFGFAFD